MRILICLVIYHQVYNLTNLTNIKPENSNRFKVGPLPQKFNIDDLPLNWKKMIVNFCIH